MRRRWTKHQLALSFLLSVVCCAAPARAYHSRAEPLIVDNAYLLPAATAQVGLWRVDIGMHRAVTMGSYHFPWFLGLANLSIKWKLFVNEKWATAARVSVFRLDLAKVAKLGSDSSATFWVLPFEFPVTRALGEHVDLSASLIYSYLAVTGRYDAQDFEGVAAASNLQLTSTLEWRASKYFAFILQGRALLFQTLAASASSTIQLDDYTTAEIAASGSTSALEVKNASSLLVGSVLSLRHFNLRLGVGYGNWSLPAVNLMLPDKRVFYDVDLYFRF